MSVTTTRDGHRIDITIDRPDAMNTLDRATVTGLVDAFDEAHGDPDVRVVVLGATGSRAFCAGRDLHEAKSLDERSERAAETPMRGRERNVFEVITECGKPTIAALFGYALGGGAELALACDVRIAHRSTILGFPEVTVGFGANFASQMLHRVCPTGAAFDLLYTGRKIAAAEAAAIHLVNRVVDDLDAAVDEYTATLLGNAPLTQQRYKAMAVKGRDLPLSAALRLESAPDPYRSHDRREGVAAFTEKRPPEFTGT